MTQQDILIVGDFNLHRELGSAPGVKLLNEILAENNLQQHVTESTHIRWHRLDLVHLVPSYHLQWHTPAAYQIITVLFFFCLLQTQCLLVL